jgi:WD40 repeat protein
MKRISILLVLTITIPLLGMRSSPLAKYSLTLKKPSSPAIKKLWSKQEEFRVLALGFLADTDNLIIIAPDKILQSSPYTDSNKYLVQLKKKADPLNDDSPLEEFLAGLFSQDKRFCWAVGHQGAESFTYRVSKNGIHRAKIPYHHGYTKLCADNEGALIYGNELSSLNLLSFISEKNYMTQPLQIVNTSLNTEINFPACGPHQQKIIALSQSDRIIIFKKYENQFLTWKILKPNTYSILSFPDSTLLIAQSLSTLKIWHLATENERDCIVQTLTHEQLECHDVRYPMIVSGSRDGIVKLWDIKTSEEKHTLTITDAKNNPQYIWRVALGDRPNATTLAIATLMGAIHLFSIEKFSSDNIY